MAIILIVIENVVNDLAFPEFNGHYPDDARLALSLRD